MSLFYDQDSDRNKVRNGGEATAVPMMAIATAASINWSDFSPSVRSSRDGFPRTTRRKASELTPPMTLLQVLLYTCSYLALVSTMPNSLLIQINALLFGNKADYCKRYTG